MSSDKISEFLILGVLLSLILAACATLSPTRQPVASTPGPETSKPSGIGSDDACQYLLNKSYRTPQNQVLGHTEQGTVRGPWVVSFLTDGRVVWKYSMEAVIGEFQCQEGNIQAQFNEGTMPAFTGVFDMETGLLTLADAVFVEIKDE